MKEWHLKSKFETCPISLLNFDILGHCNQDLLLAEKGIWISNYARLHCGSIQVYFAHIIQGYFTGTVPVPVMKPRRIWVNKPYSWQRHQMETFPVLLVLCAGNSSVTGEFPSQRPVTRGFDVFFDLCLNKCLSKQSWSWWFESPSCPLSRHCNGIHPKW